MSKFARSGDRAKQIGGQIGPWCASAALAYALTLCPALAAEDALVIGEEQFGAKIGKHAVDYGLDPGSPADTEALRGIIRSISNSPDSLGP